jgi:hypothetical protein
MNIPEIRRCSQCGRVITREAIDPDSRINIEHIFRKRNSLTAVNDACARCNQRYLEKWDLSGELPPGPTDALLNLARRTALLAQNMGEVEIADAIRRIEGYELQFQDPDSGSKRSRRRKRRVASVSDQQEMITAILSEATRYRQFLESFGFIFPSPYSQIFLTYAIRVERNPALFLEWWESTDHESFANAIGSTLRLFKVYDYAAEADRFSLLRAGLEQTANEASAFLLWLHDRIRSSETVTDNV